MLATSVAPVAVKPETVSKYASTRPRELRAAVEDERQRAEDRHQQPDQRDDEEALARRDRGALLLARDLVQREPGDARDRARDEERPERLAVADRDHDRQQEGRREPLQHAADEVEGGADVDAGRGSLTADAFDERGAARLDEDDHAVAGAQDVGAVREDRRAAADDRADHRARLRQFVEADVGQLGLGPHRQVEDLEAVVVEHRDLADARVVAEAHELLGDHLARVDGHVDAAALVDLAARSGRARARSSA